MNFCAVSDCSNRADKNKEKSFYRLPAIITHQGAETETLSTRRRREWLAAIRRKDIKKQNYQYTRVCSDHFITGSPSSLYDSTNPDWVPSLNLGHTNGTCTDESACVCTSVDTTLQRYARVQERASKRRKLDDIDAARNEGDSCVEPESTLHCEKEIQTDLRLSDLVSCEMELNLLKNKVNASTLTFESFQEDDARILYYTGLPNWEVFSVVFEFVRLDLPFKSSLSQFQQLLMTLMRLKHNFPLQDLGYRFSVHMSTISRVFNHVIDVLYIKLKPLIIWPERDVLLATMPVNTVQVALS